jgi:uncharacterized protein
MTRRQLLVAGAALALPVEGLFEKEWLEVTRHEVALPGFPRALNGLTVAQLTDLHRSAIVPREQIRDVVERCNRLAPDLVVLTGDYVTRSARFIHSCAPELARLRSRLGTLAVLGNHDYWTEAGDITAAIEREGIPVLVNQSVEAAPGFWVSGLDDSWAGDPDLHATLANVPPGASPLMLTHNPHICDAAMVRPMLILCGHTHGCQVYVPPFSQLLLPGMRSLRYVRGWYREREGLIYVNRGIGVTGVPIRFCSRPEISLFTLRAAPPGEAKVTRRVVA